MNRFSELEKKYVCEVIDNEFNTSLNSVYGNRLEAAFSGVLGSKYSIGHVNGTATMHTALAALGVKPGDEVIVPPLTMSSTALAVLQNGSVPVFADVDPRTFNITAEAIKANVTDKTRAVISVSLYGLSPDYDPILEVCKAHNLGLIEDNAECFLSYYKGKMVGTFGHFSSFSFQASKHLTCGEGGMLCTDDENLADKARKFSSLGYAGVSANQGKITRNDIQDPAYSRHVTLGFNYRLSEGNAAIALGQLERADELVGARVETSLLFDKAIEGSSLVTKQYCPDDCVNSYWSYSMVLNTDNPGVDWYRFRDLFQKNKGDGFYAAWKLSYNEPYFLNEVQHYPGIWQKYEAGLCPNSEFLQPRMIQLKTNYWNIEEAERQAEILHKTLQEFTI
jgi:perosamine synthetase